eukprot:COSAG01_NODE_32594_length_578_cov_3.728601_1_plen_73_part_10
MVLYGSTVVLHAAVLSCTTVRVVPYSCTQAWLLASTVAAAERPEAYCGLLCSRCGHKVSWEIPGVAYSPVYFR